MRHALWRDPHHFQRDHTAHRNAGQGKAARRLVEDAECRSRRGILPRAPRLANGYRDYGDHTHQVVRFVYRAHCLGFTLLETADHLDSPDDDEREARLEAELAELDAHAVEAQARRVMMSSIIDDIVGARVRNLDLLAEWMLRERCVEALASPAASSGIGVSGIAGHPDVYGGWFGTGPRPVLVAAHRLDVEACVNGSWSAKRGQRLDEIRTHH